MKTLILLAMLSGCSQLGKINTTGMLATDASLAVDWHQTQWMVKHQNEGFTEANPMLGSKPSSGLVGIYFASWITATTVAHYTLPKWFQPIVYALITSVEISTIHGNLQTGTGW